MKLFYKKYGAGPPLIILHGLYGSSDNWATIAKSLGDSFTVYLPDQRNHGLSPHNPVHDYDSMRDDLKELVDDLNLNKFFLAGHSMGGKSAISFALKWPEKLQGLLIADISPFINENQSLKAYNQHLEILRSMLALDLSMVSSRAEAESILKSSIKSDKLTGFILKNLKRSQDNKFSWKINASSLLSNLDRIMEGIDRSKSSQMQTSGFPVIFLKGENSDYIPDSDFRDILNIFPAAELIKVADAGHWIHADNPDEVISNIRKLLPDI